VTTLPAPAPLASVRRAGRARVLPAVALRVALVVPLALFAALHWAALLRPAAAGDMVALLAVAVATALAVRAVAPQPRPVVVAAATLALALLAVGAVLLICGVPLALLRPDRWGRMLSAVGTALTDLPGLRVPYRGTDPWVRIILPAGGGLLLLAGVTLALLPRPRPFGAAVALGVLYGVPVVERHPSHPYLDGAVFALLLGLLLWGAHLRERGAGVAVGLALLALVVAALVAPRVDASKPWLDYEAIAERLQGGKSTTFTWNPTYAPLTWPRDGLELARVRAKGDLYIKTANLDEFDGLRWLQQTGGPRFGPDTDSEFSARHPEWTQTIHVTIKALKSAPFLTAGTATYISHSTKTMREATPGTFEANAKPLKRGDSYDALVYVPNPSTNELHNAGSDYPNFVLRDLTVDLPATASNVSPALHVTVAPWGRAGQAFVRGRGGFSAVDAAQTLGGNPTYRPFYDLAQQLVAASRDQADYVQHVIARVQRDARYTETPPAPGRLTPLAAFLFRDHAGYCQHFAGATALLLRLGGVPARVVTGFSPGSRDGQDHVLRDLDAHSWVEAYFPHLGWVTFDPTPGDSPARSQITDTQRDRTDDTPAASAAEVTSKGRVDIAPGAVAATAAASSKGGSGWWATLGIVAGALAAVGALVTALELWRRRRLARTGDPEVEELRIALRRTGRRTTPDTTLARLEALLGGAGPATDYVAALRLARYGPGAAPPTPRQRAALRAQLRAGLGLGGRVRSWWALPPHPKELLGALRPRRRGPYIG
jgi:hypothetical protein